MPAGTRTRNFSFISNIYQRSVDGGKTWSFKAQPSHVDAGKQITVSEGHPIDPKSGHRVGGGPFYSVRTEMSFPTTRYVRKSPFNQLMIVDCEVGTPQPDGLYKGEISKSFESIRSQNFSDLDPLGATAISRCAPTNPYSNVGTSLAEIHREGLPSLPGIPTWKRRTEVLKAAGSEYLNAVFGWVPLKDEVLNVGHAARHSRDILSQFRRDEGRSIRRGYSFPIETSSSSKSTSEGWRASINPAGSSVTPQDYQTDSNLGVLTRTVTTTTRSWFSGSFTYSSTPFKDKLGDFDRYGSEADKLFGIQLTPDVLWELTPWSWAVDWFSNTGDVINNFTNLVNLGLVMQYGYIMSERTTDVTYSLSGTGTYGLSSVPNSKVITTSKSRSEANPFGFGIGWEGLSPSQLAITAALGITRLR